jgi:hypothetical protein
VVETVISLFLLVVLSLFLQLFKFSTHSFPPIVIAQALRSHSLYISKYLHLIMSDQITPAPPAQHSMQAPAPAPAPTTNASHSNGSRPATANTAAQHPSATPAAQGAAVPSTPAVEEAPTLNAKLNNADRYWKFKGVLQALAIITGLIGIGAIGWCVSTMPMNDDLTYGYDEYWTLWPTLITFAVSIIWCAACILGLIVRKRPVHPGLRVAIDLLLWLGFLVTVLFAMVALTELLQWGENGDLDNYGYSGYSSSYGDYELQANGTWVWENSRSSDSDSTTSTSYTRPCDRNSTSYSYSNTFNNCAEQDAYVNKLWQAKPHRASVEMTGVVCQFFGLVLHFALFVWACVDCHRHNRSKISKDAEKMAASIVQTMISNGAVIPPPGQAHMRPAAPWGQQQMGYYQLPPQQGQAYPMMTMYPQGMPMGQPGPQQYHAPQGGMAPGAPGVAGPSNEKSEGPRYA